MKYLYYLLTLGALAVTAFHYAGEPFLPASALAAVVFAAVLVSLTLFLLRRRPGIAHGVVSVSYTHLTLPTTPYV